MAEQYLQHFQRKFSVFLSMTTKGSLKKVRERLSGLTLSCGQIPISMDLWPSSSKPVRDVIRARLNGCDIFVQVISHEYGEISQEDGLSYTELEFEEAIKLKKPVLSFILEEEEYLAKQKASQGNKQAHEKIDAFRKKITDPGIRLWRPFSLKKIKKLEVEFLIAVQEQASSMHDGEGGWVREVDVRDAIALNQTIRNNEFFDRYVNRLKMFPTLSKRTAIGKAEKKAIATFFWDRYLPKLSMWDLNAVFFESGSTLAYVGYEFNQRLRKPWVRKYVEHHRDRDNKDDEFKILTNNILIYIDFALAEFDSDPTRVKRYPVGPADPYYGATFGELTSLVDLPAEYGNQDQSPAAQNKVKRLAKAFNAKLGGKGIILMTASGLDINTKSKFCGPHVGSYYNMLIKRALLLTKKPIAMFLHSKKIEGGSFKPGKCFAVCDASTGSWKKITQEQPIAIVTSAISESSAISIQTALHNCGLRNVESNWPEITEKKDSPNIAKAPTIITLIACNDKFKRLILPIPATSRLKARTKPNSSRK